MGNLISIFITSLIGENVVLSKFLGLCPFIGNSGNRNNAVGMGLSVTIVITLSSIITYFINYYLLVPTNSEYLQTLIFILVISSFVQILDILMKRFIPSLHKALGIYLPLITTNCVVLYVTKQICDVPALMAGLGLSSDLISNGGFDFLFAMVYALGTGCGYFLVIFNVATIREKVDHAPVVKGFEGAGIALVTTAILALAITGLAGLF